jgi:hypothetical protein
VLFIHWGEIASPHPSVWRPFGLSGAAILPQTVGQKYKQGTCLSPRGLFDFVPVPAKAEKNENQPGHCPGHLSLVFAITGSVYSKTRKLS